MARTFAVTLPAGLHIEERTEPEWDQLAHASRGVLRVETPNGMWVVPPYRAVWIPAGVSHAIRVHARVSLRSIYLRRELRATGIGDVAALNVSPLLRELIAEACRRSVLRADDERDCRLLGVVVDQLEVAELAPLVLPIPTERRAGLAAESVRENLAEVGSLSSLQLIERATRAAGASRRTLERHFLAETQMTLGAWVRRAQLVRAVELLFAGEQISSIADAVGYQTPSAFIHAFKTHMGTSPARYALADKG